MKTSDLLKTERLFRELTAELQRLEHMEADTIAGFDATDALENIRSARDSVVDARDTFALVFDNCR